MFVRREGDGGDVFDPISACSILFLRIFNATARISFFSFLNLIASSESASDVEIRVASCFDDDENWDNAIKHIPMRVFRDEISQAAMGN